MVLASQRTRRLTGSASLFILLVACGDAEGVDGASVTSGGAVAGTGGSSSGEGSGAAGGAGGSSGSGGAGGSAGTGGTGGARGCPADRRPPPGTTRAQQCDLFSSATDCTSWASVFNGVPGATGIRQIAVARHQYIAMELTVPAGVPAGATLNINTEALQAFPIQKGPVIWSVSTCPGDFNAAAIAQELEADCISSGIVANAGFNLGGADASGADSRCALTLPPGTTYYVNMLFTEDDPATTPNSALTWSCGVGDPDDCGMQMQLGSVSGW